MTGEITLRGKVLPIGGLKEKLMAAHRHGILEAIMPRENEKDLPDIPDAIKQTMKLHFVESMDEVLKIALEREIVALPMPAGSERGSRRSPPKRPWRIKLEVGLTPAGRGRGLSPLVLNEFLESRICSKRRQAGHVPRRPAAGGCVLREK